MPDLRPRSVPILTYHQVGRFDPETVRRQRGNYVDADRFRAQMRLLRRRGYEAVTLRQVQRWLERGETLPHRPVAITFDDAYACVFEYALPVLRELGWPATTFVVSGQIGGRNEWDIAKGIAPAHLMQEGEIAAVRGAGWEIGAHSRSHPRLPELATDTVDAEITGCRFELTNLAGGPPTSWCYPYGALDDRTLRAVRRAGFTAAVTLRRGVVRPNSDPLRLRRVHIGYRVQSLQFLWRVEAARLFGVG
jgi:peptidoglycan/xylan/chitin deacetylase (PgdA/CDA1 family)